MTETTIDPKDVRRGDRVTVSGVVVYTEGRDYIGVRFDGDDSNHIVAHTKTAIAHATITRPIDPDVLLVRREMAKACHGDQTDYMSGDYDNLPEFKAALAAVKAVRAEVGK